MKTIFAWIATVIVFVVIYLIAKIAAQLLLALVLDMEASTIEGFAAVAGIIGGFLVARRTYRHYSKPKIVQGS